MDTTDDETMMPSAAPAVPAFGTGDDDSLVAVLGRVRAQAEARNAEWAARRAEENAQWEAAKLAPPPAPEWAAPKAPPADEAERRKRIAALDRLCDERGIPASDDIREVVLMDAPKHTAAWDAVLEALAWRLAGKRKPVFRLLAGERGAGKTCALAWHVARYDTSGAMFVRALTISSTPRNGWSENEEKWRRWLNTPVLAIDELGRGMDKLPSDEARLAASQPIRMLLLERFEEGRATIAAGNPTTTEFWKWFGDDALADRFKLQRARGLDWRVIITDPSLRAAEAAALTEKAS